jgi:DNA-binding response OmpR family regulator
VVLKPDLLLVDLRLPGMSGVEICRQLRAARVKTPIIVLSAVGDEVDKVLLLEIGADDYVVKPFNPSELRARVQVGVRVVELQGALADRVGELEQALANVRQLSGLLPICSYCKKIRDDQNYWQQVEAFVGTRTDATFSHSICPECYDRHVRKDLARMSGSGSRPAR